MNQNVDVQLSTLSTTGLRKVFTTPAETVAALDGIDLQVPAGQFLALLGASGCGKTTLINVLAGLEEPTEGEVHVLDMDVARSDLSALAHMRLGDVGVIFQDNNLIEEFSALENVALPLVAQGMARKVAREAASDALASVGLEGMEKRFPRLLSGGQQQRVGVARALVGGRSVLLADEPTGALDTDNSRALFAIFRRLCDEGTTVAIATHDPLIHEYADRVVYLRDGRITEDRDLQRERNTVEG